MSPEQAGAKEPDATELCKGTKDRNLPRRTDSGREHRASQAQRNSFRLLTIRIGSYASFMSLHARDGRAVGATIMFFFGAIWLLLGVLGGRPSPGWLRAGLLVAGFLLGVWIAIVVHRVSHVSEAAPPILDHTAVGPQIGRRFGWITGIEGAAIFLAVILLNVVHRPDFIPPAIAFIVGLHFFPLASLFGRSVYCGTGILGCAIGGSAFFISDPSLRTSVVGLSFGLLLWLTTLTVLFTNGDPYPFVRKPR